MLHGRLLGGIMARAVEGHVEDDLRVARLTVDLFRNTPIAPVRVEACRVRDGRRIRVVDVVVHAADGPAARASALLLRGGPVPPGEVPVTPAWGVPPPDRLGPPLDTTLAGRTLPWDLWLLGDHDEVLRDGRRPGRRAWIRDRYPLVPGEPLTPLVRVALAADFASPVAHAGTAGLRYINADYTVHLSRPPAGEAIGVQFGGHLADGGVAVGTCVLHDATAPIGFCTVSAVANERRG